MNRIVRTYDPAIIKAVFLHPTIWNTIQDDEAICPAFYEPKLSEDLIYLAAFDDDELLGIVLFHRESAATVKGHMAFLPNSYGHRTKETIALAFDWLWTHTSYVRIYAGVPALNALARQVCERVGMTRFGINQNAWLKGGKLWDVFLYGLSKPEVEHGR